MPELNWIGKNAVVNHHREVPYRLVHCDSELSAGDADSGNLLVQGDNLEALKALLPYYAGKVKCIYIDPPYNTGNENWVYNDNVNSARIKQWLGKIVGAQADDLSRHDKWLCMMYPRLRLLREFLREDGVIFISIDDNELHHLILLMNEIFGPTAYVSSIAWQKVFGRNNTAKFISDTHEHIVCFARNIKALELNLLERGEGEDSRYKNPDSDPRGPWTSSDLSARNPYSLGVYPLRTPSGREIEGPPAGRYWTVSKENFEKLDADNRIWWGTKGNNFPRLKRFLSEVAQGVIPNSLWMHSEVGHNQEAKQEVGSIFHEANRETLFSTPKPKRLIRRILQIATNPGDIVMDSFAGSGTTGHAVLDMNKQDGGNRQFILVEMDEKIAPDTTGERLRRVINGYHKGGDVSKPVEGLGGGFRYCRLGTPLFDEFGDIDGAVSFSDLAAHVFFSETGAPIPQRVDGSTPLVGQHGEQIVYLLYSEPEQGFAREEAGNVLTPDMLASLPDTPEGFEGERVVYAEGCTVSADRLKTEGIVFKQIPYSIQGA
ncbi:adenine specific DNA methylase [Roseobacter sp. SK209-2-6]|uniref:site-specific DNA-methyltransferase n=1 Tax=Roseobacter sp. SK209-2-6 TaxID=388739 RepID=UPI0000F3E3FF|nr:site-specific DNA-methyltransferase [Roseobacter sp. SK209-2-6]EBA14426.1 adenine specific DNA methylase [Roseobacter sp. SK209-2-6]